MERSKVTFLHRKHTDHQKAQGKMLHIQLSEKCKPKVQWAITLYQSERPSPKNLQKVNAGECVEK